MTRKTCTKIFVVSALAQLFLAQVASAGTDGKVYPGISCRAIEKLGNDHFLEPADNGTANALWNYDTSDRHGVICPIIHDITGDYDPDGLDIIASRIEYAEVVVVGDADCDLYVSEGVDVSTIPDVFPWTTWINWGETGIRYKWWSGSTDETIRGFAAMSIYCDLGPNSGIMNYFVYENTYE